LWPIGTQPRPYLHVDCAGTFFLAIGLPTWTGDFKAVPGLGNGKQARSWGRRGPTFRQLHCGDDHFLLGQYYVEKAFRDVGILAERLGLPLLRKEIAEARYKIPRLDRCRGSARRLHLSVVAAANRP
jgi:hypothetical protein